MDRVGESKVSYFEEDKRGKLARLKVLRFMNAIGMIAWREDRYGCAQQCLRMLHPLSWVWLFVYVCFAVVMHGAIEVFKELKRTWKEETVWW